MGRIVLEEDDDGNELPSASPPVRLAHANARITSHTSLLSTGSPRILQSKHPLSVLDHTRPDPGMSSYASGGSCREADDGSRCMSKPHTRASHSSSRTTTARKRISSKSRRWDEVTASSSDSSEHSNEERKEAYSGASRQKRGRGSEMDDFIVGDREYNESYKTRRTTRSPAKSHRGGGQSMVRMGRAERDDSGDEEEDMDDFIVEDDASEEEEEEEEEEGEEEQEEEKGEEEEAPKSARGTGVRKPSSAEKAVSSARPKRAITLDDSDEEANYHSCVHAKTSAAPAVSMSEGGMSAVRRRILAVESEDDEEEEAGGDESLAMRSVSEVIIVNTSDEEAEEEEDEEEEDEEEDGVAMYWRVDQKLSNSKAAVSGSAEKHLSLSEYFERYLEMMLRVHTDAEALRTWRKNPSSADSAKYITATHKVQDMFCTYRESVLGSSAWSGTFMQELLSRPFYVEKYATGGRKNLKCHACKRGNHECPYILCLFGETYDAKRLWEASLWDEHLPPGVLYHESLIESDSSSSDEDDDDDDEEEEEEGKEDGPVNLFNVQDPNVLHERDYAPQAAAESYASAIDRGRRGHGDKWWLSRVACLNSPASLLKMKESFWDLSSNCLARTKMYHAMLHYKLRLMLSVRKRLDLYGGSVSSVLKDRGYMKQEKTRYLKAIKSVREWSGHGAMTDMWGDRGNSGGKNKSASKRISPSKPPRPPSSTPSTHSAKVHASRQMSQGSSASNGSGKSVVRISV